MRYIDKVYCCQRSQIHVIKMTMCTVLSYAATEHYETSQMKRYEQVTGYNGNIGKRTHFT